MGLIHRLEGSESPKVPVHQFMAALGEYKRGAASQAQIVAAFNLSEAEETQLEVYLSNLDTDAINRQLIHDVLLLLERGHYTVGQAKERLGV